MSQTISFLLNHQKQLAQQNEQILDLLKNKNSLENKVKEHIEISIEESKEKIDRQKNLILYNIPEGDSELESTNSENDSTKVKEVLNFVCSDIKTQNLKKKTSMSRLGKKKRTSSKNIRHLSQDPLE